MFKASGFHPSMPCIEVLFASRKVVSPLATTDQKIFLLYVSRRKITLNWSSPVDLGSLGTKQSSAGVQVGGSCFFCQAVCSLQTLVSSTGKFFYNLYVVPDFPGADFARSFLTTALISSN